MNKTKLKTQKLNGKCIYNRRNYTPKLLKHIFTNLNDNIYW